ncbi:MAG TPA: hypothetical protein EYO09_02255 [Candidatus Poseidoniales archaeon]|nr:hypothetical protein [Candidatus Poseidoniales archaeon]
MTYPRIIENWASAPNNPPNSAGSMTWPNFSIDDALAAARSRCPVMNLRPLPWMVLIDRAIFSASTER